MRYFLIFGLIMVTFSQESYACKMTKEGYEKQSIDAVKDFINGNFSDVKIEKIEMLNSGRIRVVSNSSIPKRYRVVFSSDCKKTVNVINSTK